VAFNAVPVRQATLVRCIKQSAPLWERLVSDSV
jgi:hypothetical protein